MKRLFGSIAAAALLVSPLSAMAQHGGGGGHGGMGGGGGWHGGGMGGGGWHGGGGWGGGGWHGGGWGGGAWHGGGAWGGGWHGGYYHGGCWGCFLGFGLGFAAAYPWYYWGGYPYWWYGAPYPYPYYGYYGGYYGYDDNGDGYPDGYYAPPAATGPAACGQWVWRADQSRYEWVPQACAAPVPQAAPAPGY